MEGESSPFLRSAYSKPSSDVMRLKENEGRGRRDEVREEVVEREGKEEVRDVEDVSDEEADLTGRTLDEGETDRGRSEGGLSGMERRCGRWVLDRVSGLRDEGETEMRLLFFSSASSVCTRRESASSRGGGTMEMSVTCLTLAVPLMDPRNV